MAVIFWAALFLLWYVFIGYALVLWFLIRHRAKTVEKGVFEPTVSLIISAYNEEAVIREKIENTFALSYPKEKLEIIVCSDGSTDETDTIVRSFGDRVKLLRIEGRRGKPECQNQGAAYATGDILVFSDANSMYDREALRALLANLNDSRVGVVCGELRYKRNDKSDEGVYWRLEKFLKEGESKLGSCLGANGAIYAMRRELYHPLPAEACSDFIEPFFAYAKGFRVVYEPKAFCYETPGDNAQEFNRKKRIIVNSLQSLYLIAPFLNPLRYGWYSVALWSHKMLRWFAFVLLILVFVTSLLSAGHSFFMAVLALQLLFYGFALLGAFISWKPFTIPYYFVLVNMASLLAVFDTVFGKKVTAWEKAR